MLASFPWSGGVLCSSVFSALGLSKQVAKRTSKRTSVWSWSSAACGSFVITFSGGRILPEWERAGKEKTKLFWILFFFFFLIVIKSDPGWAIKLLGSCWGPPAWSYSKWTWAVSSWEAGVVIFMPRLTWTCCKPASLLWGLHFVSFQWYGFVLHWCLPGSSDDRHLLAILFAPSVNVGFIPNSVWQVGTNSYYVTKVFFNGSKNWFLFSIAKEVDLNLSIYGFHWVLWLVRNS